MKLLKRLLFCNIIRYTEYLNVFHVFFSNSFKWWQYKEYILLFSIVISNNYEICNNMHDFKRSYKLYNADKFNKKIILLVAHLNNSIRYYTSTTFFKENKAINHIWIICRLSWLCVYCVLDILLDFGIIIINSVRIL